VTGPGQKRAHRVPSGLLLGIALRLRSTYAPRKSRTRALPITANYLFGSDFVGGRLAWCDLRICLLFGGCWHSRRRLICGACRPSMYR
jgi:hypothetical protein